MGGDLGVVPTVFLVPVDGDHVVGEIFAESGVGEVFGDLFVWDGIGVGGTRESNHGRKIYSCWLGMQVVVSRFWARLWWDAGRWVSVLRK